MKQRATRIEESAEIIGATTDNNTGAGPPHWYENYNPKNSRPWMIADAPDYQVPQTTQEARDRAAKVRAARRGGDGYYRGPFDGPEDFTLYVRCITRGVPGSMMPAIYGNSYQIGQGPGVVTITYEMVHDTRVIPIDPSTRPPGSLGASPSTASGASPSTGLGAGTRPHISSKIRQYLGDARGRWEGTTLVVETTNFNDRAPYRGSSDQLRIVERFTPIGPDTLEWAITFDDPHTWARPWTFAMNLTHDESQPPFEYACHEGNYGLRNILSAARAEERMQAIAAEQQRR
jgi:hypothetical protein